MPPSVITYSLPLFSCICIFSRPPFSAPCFWFDIFFLQARPNGDNMFGGDKQTHAASEGSLGKYGCLGSGLPLPRGDQTKAQLWAAEIAFASAAFGDMRHAQTMQVVKKSAAGTDPIAPPRAEIMVLICKRWHGKDAADASLQHGGTTGRGTICNHGGRAAMVGSGWGEFCHARRCRV